MFSFISKLLWWRKTELEEEEEGFDQGYYGIPHPKERAKMSPEKLAIVLSHCVKDSPQHILVDHELSRRIAKIQAMPTYVGILSGLAGVVLGAWLNAAFQSQQKVECKCECNHVSENKRAGTGPIMPVPPISRPLNEKNSVTNGNTKQLSGNAKP